MRGSRFWVWGDGQENYGGDEICLAPFGWVQGARFRVLGWELWWRQDFPYNLSWVQGFGFKVLGQEKCGGDWGAGSWVQGAGLENCCGDKVLHAP